jgi:murein DD-endopeptidase MepM/ murein hydrolase activator NlpD
MAAGRIVTVCLAACGLLLVAGVDGLAQGIRDGRRGGMTEQMPGRVPEEPSEGKAGPEVIGAFSPLKADIGHMRARGFLATGLKPIYPAEATCWPANSFFGETTRGDGSPRSRKFYLGYHGGLDIPVPEGTPILAVADGTVVHMKEGANIGGIGLILQHSPEDTGLPVWIYTEYKHLKEMPALVLGQRVRMGEAIALAGLSGTTGGYYGPGGHSHLHLSAWFAPVREFRDAIMFIPADGQWMDPLALFRGPPLESKEIAGLPEAAKKVLIPYVPGGGSPIPAGTKVVWPFACMPR